MVGVERPIYEEHLSSGRTAALFVALAALFGGLCGWRLAAGRPD